nr:retrovirus-related Pol polyprotein from transposon TNT 1-94 [Tanacetum cinerariifolium]
GCDNEYFNPPSSVVSSVPVVASPRTADIVGSPLSTNIDQDAPSSSTSSTKQQEQYSVISQGVEEPIPNALSDDPYHEPLHDVSISQQSSSNVQSSLSIRTDWTPDANIRKRLILRCSWSSKEQKSITISSTEAEYIALSGCCAQIL